MGRLNIYSDSYNDATVISNRFFDEYMKDANDAQLKVYLYLIRIMSANLTTSISDIADKFNHTEKDVIRSLKYWEKVHLLQLDYDEKKNIVGIHMQDLNRNASDANASGAGIQNPDVSNAGISDAGASGAGISSATAPVMSASGTNAQIVRMQPKQTTPALKKPDYTAADLDRFSSNPDITQILFVAETYLGKTLSENEVKTLLFVYDVLGFSVELMDYLIEYCVGRDKKEMKYIEKVAIDWANNNIKTVRQAKLRSNKYDKTVYTVMKALGKTNTPTETEAGFITKWLNTYAFSPEVIAYACEKTVLATDSHRIEYAEGILSRWYEAGLKTKEQIKGNEQKFQQTRRTVKPAGTTSNKFNEFKQNTYDFASLEQEILSN